MFEAQPIQPIQPLVTSQSYDALARVHRGTAMPEDIAMARGAFSHGVRRLSSNPISQPLIKPLFNSSDLAEDCLARDQAWRHILNRFGD